MLACGCGKRMTPYAPDRVLPAAVRNFQLTQEGDALVLSWQLPRLNQLGQPLTQVQGCQLYRAALKGVSPEALGSSDFVLYADIDLAYPQRGEVQGEAMLFRDRELVPDHRYYYRVAAYDQNGYKGNWSQTLSHSWGSLPRLPGGFKAVPGDKIVALSWNTVTALQDGSPVRDLAGYLVYRRSGKGPWMRVTPVPVLQNQFQDVAVLNDVEYTYKIVAVRRVGDDLLASHDSVTQVAMPEKRTPPPPVLNFLAVPTSQGVELRWELSPAPDVAGYRVYRRLTGEEKYSRLTPELVRKPYFVDSKVTRGQTYHYYVTAVDDSPRANESLPSEVAAVTY
jgi:fibronectin type 3 domain-containing protein